MDQGTSFTDRAFSRAAGAPLITGNAVRLLRDADENYEAWLAAIAGASRHVHFESYIIHADRQGARFADALIAKAREGVAVRLLYDWLGAVGNSSRRFWRRLRAGGVEVRCFNPPQMTTPLSWVTRDHRKVLAVDGSVGFVSGLCVGDRWVGDPARGHEPWRDTGVEIRGPAVAEIERAFAAAWATAGPVLPTIATANAAAGSVNVRVIATEPSTAGLYRLDKLVAALARHRLWLTDAYFLGGTSYVQALIGAARDGVDVRLLVPGTSDVPIVRALSRAGYRSLLEGGVRIYEWNGPMLHAKTAVADGFWSRVGSTNLNDSSWLGNWELDVAIEDADFGGRMERMFLEDLEHATEIVLTRHSKVIRSDHPAAAPAAAPRPGGGRAKRVVAGVVGWGGDLGTAVGRRRALGHADSNLLLVGGMLLLAVAALAYEFPRAIAVPVAVLGAWCAVGLIVRGVRLRRTRAVAAALLHVDAASQHPR
jgi:cardiolipin synthase